MEKTIPIQGSANAMAQQGLVTKVATPSSRYWTALGEMRSNLHSSESHALAGGLRTSVLEATLSLGLLPRAVSLAMPRLRRRLEPPRGLLLAPAKGKNDRCVDGRAGPREICAQLGVALYATSRVCQQPTVGAGKQPTSSDLQKKLIGMIPSKPRHMPQLGLRAVVAAGAGFLILGGGERGWSFTSVS
jgi:hypothetical protein